MAESLGWRWEFGVQVPFLLLCLGLSIIVLPDRIGICGPRQGVWDAIREFDGRGSALLATATATLILGLVGPFYEELSLAQPLTGELTDTGRYYFSM
jgi:predicted MFS family arabinose efflux permease